MIGEVFNILITIRNERRPILPKVEDQHHPTDIKEDE